MSLMTEEAATNFTRVPGKYGCGFCATGHHDICPGLVRNATDENPDRTWMCPCYHNNHGIITE
jgi:hypothetical protein